jgi:uncharacterized protein (TIGR04222 family)
VNPFDLYGPQFLVFYMVVAAATIAALVFLRRRQESTGLRPPQLEDPYLVAYLRGRESEALRVVMMSLLDRGLLKSVELTARKGLVLTRVKDAPEIAARPIEKEVLKAFSGGVDAREALDALKAKGVCDAYAAKLTEMDLLPDEEAKNARQRLAFGAMGFLLSVTAIKIVVALSRGRTNLLFLLIATAAAAFLAFKVANPFRTAQGDEFLNGLTTLFGSLRGRAESLRPGGATSELAWLAAVFGLSAVPAAVFPQVRMLQAVGAPSLWVDGGSGSSCGSSCGGGCGSGCGGGCGGCGS